MTVQKDILPLPSHDVYPLHDIKHLSRSVQQRLKFQQLKQDWRRDAHDALNDLGGFTSSAGDSAPKVGAGTHLAMDVVASAFDDLVKPCSPLPSPDEALRELLSSTTAYHGASTVLPYAKDLVSWPPVGSHPVPLAAGLSEADRTWLAEWKAHLLPETHSIPSTVNDNVQSTSNFTTNAKHIPSSPSNPKTKKAYCDPVLFSSGENYADFLKRLEAAGMLKWRRAGREKGVLGVFFVKKKNGTLRCDTRVLNQSFNPPPSHSPSVIGVSRRPCGPARRGFVLR